jgi:GTPase
MMDDSTAATTTTAVNKINVASGPIIPKERKNVLVKRDIVRKKEPINIIFCGHVDAGKSTIGGQLM